MTWLELLGHWRLIEPDLHDVYGVDVDEPGLLRARTWRWLRVRIVGLLAGDTRLARALAPPPDSKTPGARRRPARPPRRRR